MRMNGWFTIAAAIALAAAGGCGGDGGGAGGSGGTTGSGGSSSSSSGTGGAAAGCLDGAAFASLFTIADPAFCAVAVYEADASIGYQAPTWGAHGGPLWMEPDATGVTFTRAKAPAGSTGKLTLETAHVDAAIPAGAFAGAQAVDLPFFGWTAISWTGAFPDTAGKVLMIKDGAVGASYDANGVYAIAAAGSATGGRLLTTALSPIGSTASGANALYGADACDTPAPDLGAGTGCGAPAAIAAWGDSSGPLAVDRDGNAFAVLASFATGDQEARGFAAAEIARGAAPADGASLFTLPGFGSSLAALAPSGSSPGLLVFQPFDMNAAPLDVIAQPYTVASGVTAMGAPAKLLAMPAVGAAALSLVADDQDRLWVAASGDAATTFVVIAKKP